MSKLLFHWSKRKILLLFTFLLIAGATGASVWFFMKYQKAESMLQLLQNGGQASTQEVEELVSKVGKLIVLPDEAPTVATVTEKEKLVGQEFFLLAENDDKVLIYTGAKKAFLYRPKTNKLINVAALSLQNTPQEGAPTTEVQPEQVELVQYQVALYNGTSTPGVTTSYEERLKTSAPELIVSARTNAAKSDYERSFIVDVKGGQSKVVSDLADKLGLEVQPFPEGETRPASDILIILGSDIASN